MLILFIRQNSKIVCFVMVTSENDDLSICFVTLSFFRVQFIKIIREKTPFFDLGNHLFDRSNLGIVEYFLAIKLAKTFDWNYLANP